MEPPVKTSPRLPRSKSLPEVNVLLTLAIDGAQSHGERANRKYPKFIAPEILDKKATIWHHYYTEGGWGWCVLGCALLVQILNHGLQLSLGMIVVLMAGTKPPYLIGWLGAFSMAVSLSLSPVTIGICRQKSTRLTAVVGGLVVSLGCLFTSFATRFSQLFFSYGAVIGFGVGLTRDAATLMVAQYFKRKRELVEIPVICGSGLSIAVMSTFFKTSLSNYGWRLGLQVVTGVLMSTFILGMFYRSASLYHPQRRAILHLKSMRRKIKDKSKIESKTPFFDFKTLKSKTVQIILLGSAFVSMGIHSPIIYIGYHAKHSGADMEEVLMLQVYLGLGWVLGAILFGAIFVTDSKDKKLAKHYLCQASGIMCGLSLLSLPAVTDYKGYVIFVWVFGVCCGAYHYTLKIYVFEKVRARNFARAWGFVQFSQGVPILIGVPATGYICEAFGSFSGFYLSAASIIVGSLFLCLIDVHKRSIAKHKHLRNDGKKHTCLSELCPEASSGRKLSFQEIEEIPPAIDMWLDEDDLDIRQLFELNDEGISCLSNEALANLALADNYFDDNIPECISSCNDMERYLMLSEFEQNLNKAPGSLKATPELRQNVNIEDIDPISGAINMSRIAQWRFLNRHKYLLRNLQFDQRSISVIEESTTSAV